MKNNKRIKISSIIRGYMIFPVTFSAIIAVLCVAMYFRSFKAGTVTLCVLLIYVAATVTFYLLNRRMLAGRLHKFARDYEEALIKFTGDFPLAYALTDHEGSILIYNDYFSRIYDGDAGTTNLCDLFKELNRQDLSFEEEEKDFSVVYDKRNYRLHIKRFPVEQELLHNKLYSLISEEPWIYTVVLYDETEIVSLMRAKTEQQLVVGVLHVDDYESVLKQVPDENQSMSAALIDKTIIEYFAKSAGIVRKTEKDKYFIIFKRKYLSAMQSARFDLLDEIKSIDPEFTRPVTVSMGIGVGEDYKKICDYAALALELALGRGGDQVVVKEGERTYFYGGKTKSVEKNSRVKARVTSIALREILLRKENVVIMGHQIEDIDCFGASVGIYNAAKALGKKAYIILNNLTNTVQPVLERFLDSPGYGDAAFVEAEDAEDYVNENTALVIVDVNNPDYFERPELIEKTDTVVVIDHHLQSGDKIEKAALWYVEPSASSASEMVTELLQYISDEAHLSVIEAEALYAGILIDTNYFSKNTGVKTFEAAAFLKRFGVDVSAVKRMFSDSVEEYRAKAQAKQNVEMIAPGYVMAVSEAENIETPTVLAAQIANELLDISDVRGSFVMVDVNKRIYISARSVGDCNVQLAMERLGGGGHLNTAGAQLSGITMDEAKRQLKNTVLKLIEEGILQ